MIVLGVDPGLTCPAAALVSFDGTPKILVAKSFSGIAKRCPPDMLLYLRCSVIAEEMSAEMWERGEYRGGVLAIEGPSFTKGSRSAEQLACCRQAIFCCLSLPGTSTYIVSPREAKLALTGHGASDKVAMLQYAKSRFEEWDSIVFGLKAKDVEAIVDAVAIALAGEKLHKRKA